MALPRRPASLPPAALERMIAASGARPGPSFACPYLVGRTARHLAIAPVPLRPGLYESLMTLGFRRSGEVFYRTACEGCDECRPLRVDAVAFEARRSQRRCQAVNGDLRVDVCEPTPSAEKLVLYRRYLEGRHDGQMSGSVEEFERFLYEAPLEAVELEYRLEGRLVAVGLADVEPTGLSAVYCYFDPDLPRRSLGVFNVLRFVEECRRRERRWLYLGYYVAGSRAMRYKAEYRPCEILGPDGWAPL